MLALRLISSMIGHSAGEKALGNAEACIEAISADTDGEEIKGSSWLPHIRNISSERRLVIADRAPMVLSCKRMNSDDGRMGFCSRTSAPHFQMVLPVSLLPIILSMFSPHPKQVFDCAFIFFLVVSLLFLVVLPFSSFPQFLNLLLDLFLYYQHIPS